MCLSPFGEKPQKRLELHRNADPIGSPPAERGTAPSSPDLPMGRESLAKEGQSIHHRRRAGILGKGHHHHVNILALAGQRDVQNGCLNAQ